MDGSETATTPSETATRDRVQVVVRLRPLKPNTETAGALHILPSGKKIILHRGDDASVRKREFTVDRVLDDSTSQQEVYQDAVAHLVDDVVDGYNACLLAYGQTGAGKTYTMANTDPQAVGMIPRAAAGILAATQTDPTYSVFMSMVEIYMERVYDLLKPDLNTNTNTTLQLREDASGEVFISNIHRVKVTSLEDCLGLLQYGSRARSTASTLMNDQSSRSHAVVMFDVIRTQNYGTGLQHVQHGRLFLVDLAGSERTKKSGSVGARADEAKSINLSLTCLGKCIAARASGDSKVHVPFRESKLTRLLSGALSGSAKACIIVNVSDSLQHTDETMQSLQFGSQAMRVTVQARVNTRVEYTALDPGLQKVLMQTGQRAVVLEKTLLARETAMRDLEVELKKEQEQSRRVVEALKQEHHQAQAQIAFRLEQAQQEAQDVGRRNQMLVERLAATEEQLDSVQQKLIDAEIQYKKQIDSMSIKYAEKESELQDRIIELSRQLLEAKHSAQDAHAQLAQEREEFAASKGSMQRETDARIAAIQQSRQFQLDQAKTAAAAQEAVVNDCQLQIKEYKETIAHLTESVDILKATLSDEKSRTRLLTAKNSQLQELLQQEEQQLAAVKRQVQDFVEDKRRNNAARTIQRQFRLYKSRQTEQDLLKTRAALGTLMEQHADVEARRQASLALSGQTLLLECINILEQGAESLFTTFVLPSKDLKTLNKYAARTLKTQAGDHHRHGDLIPSSYTTNNGLPISRYSSFSSSIADF